MAYVKGLIGIYKYKDSSEQTGKLTKFIHKSEFTPGDMKTIDTMVNIELRFTGETQRINDDMYLKMIEILMKTEIENGMITKINSLSKNTEILRHYKKLIDIKFLAMIASLREKVDDDDDGIILDRVENYILDNVSNKEFIKLLKQLEDIMSNLETHEKNIRNQEADDYQKLQDKYMILYDGLLKYYYNDESKIKQLNDLRGFHKGHPIDNRLFSSKDMNIIDKMNQEKTSLESKIRSSQKSPTPNILRPVLKKSESKKLSPKTKTPSKQTMRFLTFSDSR
jgi:hypothetical protein